VFLCHSLSLTIASFLDVAPIDQRDHRDLASMSCSARVHRYVGEDRSMGNVLFNAKIMD